LHELATNATKHGALAGRVGAVRIDWQRQPGNGVELRWIESGGPPVAPPKRKGFGQVVFERIGASLEGEVKSDFLPEGLACSVTIAASNFFPDATFS
jgi:two-component sensor histidine kinase